MLAPTSQPNLFIFCFNQLNIIALYRLEENPDEAKIWVTSSGKDNALFSWEVWRRLPLHEVSCYIRVEVFG